MINKLCLWLNCPSITQQGAHETGFLARIGGDEFCILIPDADLKTATNIAQNLAQTIVDTPFKWKNDNLTFAASFGLSHWTPAFGITLTESLSDADSYLLQTKRISQIELQSSQVNNHHNIQAKLA